MTVSDQQDFDAGGSAEPEGLLPQFQTFSGQAEFVSLVRSCVVSACEQGTVNLVFCDTDFSNWPLDDEAIIAALQSWANSTSNQRMLVMVAATYGFVEQNHGAWVRWRKIWDHRVQCWQLNAQADPNLPGVFWSRQSMVVVHDRERCTGMMSREGQRIIREKGRLDEFIRQSDPAFPASTLGLW